MSKKCKKKKENEHFGLFLRKESFLFISTFIFLFHFHIYDIYFYMTVISCIQSLYLIKKISF